MATLRIAWVSPAVSASAWATFCCSDSLRRARSPRTRICTPFSCNSPTSRSMVSPKSRIRAVTSPRGRCQFSVLKAYRVRMCTPAWWHASITGRIARTPARCPATRGRWRCLSHRPLPSMMMPTCRGRSALAGSGIAAGSGGRCIVVLGVRTPRRLRPFRRWSPSDLEDLSLLPLDGVVDPGDEQVRDLLRFDEFGRHLVLAHVAILLDAPEMLDLIAADIPHRDTRLLGLAVDDLDELLTPLRSE